MTNVTAITTAATIAINTIANMCDTAANYAKIVAEKCHGVHNFIIGYNGVDTAVYNLFTGKRAKRIAFVSVQTKTKWEFDISDYVFVGMVDFESMHFHGYGLDRDNPRYREMQMEILSGRAVRFEDHSRNGIDFLEGDHYWEGLDYALLEFEDGSSIKWVNHNLLNKEDGFEVITR